MNRRAMTVRVCVVTVCAAVPAGCPAYRITEIPRRPEPPQAGARAAGRRRSRPAAARGRAGGRLPRGHRRGRGVERQPGRVRLGADGGGRAGSCHRGRGRAGRQRRPGRRGGAAGAAGRGARDGAAAGRARPGCSAQLGCWREIAGISDGLLALPARAAPAAPGAGGRAAGLSLDEGLLGSWTGPFGWLVIGRAGEPRPSCGRCRRRPGCGSGWPRGRPTGSPSGRRRRGGSRSGTPSCSAAQSTGFWRITIAAGGTRRGRARPGWPGCCARRPTSSGLPYALSPAPGGRRAGPARAGRGRRAGVAVLRVDRAAGRARPAAGGGGAGGPAGAPARLRRHPGAAAGAAGRAAGVELGADPGPEPACRRARSSLPRDSLNRHVFVCGATGAGKSQTVRSLLEAATGQGIPWLVVEPAKAEYRLMASRACRARR